MDTTTKRVRWRKHYNSSQKILLVGEGDFSFAASLARAFGSATNMVATSLLSEDELMRKHWGCGQHLDLLYERDCMVLHRVDAFTMKRHRILRDMKFDVIVFNFPHAGHVAGLCELDEELIEMHKELMSGFFESASKMLKEGGQVHVTQKDGQVYDKWNVLWLAAAEGLRFRQQVEFLKKHHPGYHNKRGGDIGGNKTFPMEGSSTYVFSLSPVINPGEETSKIELALQGLAITDSS